MRKAVIVAAIVCSMPGWGQTPSYSEGKFEGRQAYILENASMRVTALRGAGHLAEIVFKSGDPKKDVNPMRVPHFPTIEPWEYDPAKHEQIYGGGVNRILQSGYMGHLLNFPLFGSPSPQEAANGLGTHGEALAVEWKKNSALATKDAVQLSYSAHLPLNQYNVGRVLTLPAGETVLYVEEWVESLTAFDRPVHWVQHVTFGPPFAEPGKTVMDASATKGEVRGEDLPFRPLAPGPLEWPWGAGKDGTRISLREMLSQPRSGAYYAMLMNPERQRSYFTMYHKDYNVLIGYVWRTEDFPWIADWQENKRNTEPPWNGQVVARGIEVGTTPFGGPMKATIREGSLYGVPTFRWIHGRERATVRYIAFLSEIPEGFQGVADIQIEDGKILIQERGSGRTMSLTSALPW